MAFFTWPQIFNLMFQDHMKGRLSHLFIYLLAIFWEKNPQAHGVGAFFRLNHSVTSIFCRGQDQIKLVLKPSMPWSSIHNLAFINQNLLEKKKSRLMGTIICDSIHLEMTQCLAAPFVKRCSAMYLESRRGQLSNCMYIGSQWQAFHATMQATHEPPIRNTCLVPQVYVMISDNSERISPLASLSVYHI